MSGLLLHEPGATPSSGSLRQGPTVLETVARRSGEEAVRGFYTHLTIFVTVNGSLLALNLLAGGPAWAVWPLIGWGIGVVAHGIAAFLGKPHGPDGGRLTAP